MPPKAEKKKPNAKDQQKKLQKVIEDKTFGMKNKKGAKAQKFIQSLQNQVQGDQKKLQQQQQAKKKKEEQDDMRDLSKIFKPIQEMPKIAADVDPKSVLCVFFKQGMCTKGKKCKFSHDLSIQQKTAKRNLYVDSRDLKGDDKEAETNENWDEDQLNEVAEKKHGEKDRKRPNQTEIVCKYFIEAVENNKYGWFWECPNGEKCIYRHALPPGYVLSKDKKKMDEQKRLEQISLEELIEKERANLSSKNQTKVTLESFIAWKKKKLIERRQKEKQDEVKKRTNAKAGKQAGLTGRELFLYNDKFNVDEQDEEGGTTFVREKGSGWDEVKAFEIDDKTFMDFGEDGALVDIDSDDEKPPVVIDESVFNAENLDEDLDNLDLSDEESEQDDDPTGSGTQ
ncbi:Zinc finger CCCH domain-containing protein 15-like protein [Aphelenchoides bicaudatus]|nr:Zinc finger CCCH domain-containing protein 15-like protein [Aphelenchoides bicaudatus]